MTARPPKPEIESLELTPEQEVMYLTNVSISEQISGLRDQISRLDTNRPRCEAHVYDIWGPIRESDWYWSDWDNKWHLNASVRCIVCNADGGWYCPDNPNGRFCEYHDGDPDACDHCGNPDERK